VDWPSLQPEVAEWEPREALLAGPDGLAAIREVVPRVEMGTLALEVGAGQAEAVMELLRDAGFVDLRTRRDLAGVKRIVWGSRG
jgi:release factor glutamine methyltransferase